MKQTKISNAFDYVGDELIADAAEQTQVKKRPAWVKWGSIAASFLVLIGAVGLILPNMLADSPRVETGDNHYDECYRVVFGVARPYQQSMIVSELAFIWPWHYQTSNEQFGSLSFGGQKYVSGREVGAEWIEKELGIGHAEGYDIYEEQTYTADFPVYKVRQISEERLIAVLMDGHYYVYQNADDPIPDTLGGLLDEYALPDTLSLTRFSVDTDTPGEYRTYTTEQGDAIWQMLGACRDAVNTGEAPFVEFDRDGAISFTATSEPLGIYRLTFCISPEGYLWTNICRYLAVYRIDPQLAARIVETARRGAVEVETEPYRRMLCGTVTEIGEDYFLLDDSIMCRDPEEGMVFKILLDSLRVRRCLAFPEGNITVGSTVAVYFEGNQILGEDNTLSGAVSVEIGYLTDDGNMAVPE